MAGRKTAFALLIAVAVVVAIALPPSWTAESLAGRESPLRATVETGVWIFKGALLLNVLLLVGLSRLRQRASSDSRRPLAALHPERGDVQPAGTPVKVTLGIMLLIGTALRLFDLGDGLWFDEIQTLVDYARRPLAHILTSFDSQNNHVLYSLLAHVSIVSFGDGAWALRLPAALFGVASLWALYWFATLIVSRVEALVATALLTLSYHHVWFSQNARGYTGLLFWSLVASGLLLQLFARRSVDGAHRLVIGYAIAAALAVYTHSSALFLVCAHGCVWLALLARAAMRDRVADGMDSARSIGAAAMLPLAAFVLAGTFALQLYALVLPQFVRTLTEPTMAGMATEWKNPLWFLAETARGLTQGIPGGFLVVAAGVAVGLAGVVGYWRRSAAATALMLLPGLVTATVLLVLEHNFWPRFFFFSAGFAVLIVVRGVYTLAEMVLAPTPLRKRAPALATASLALVALASATTVPGAWHPKQDFAGAREFVERQAAPGDAVVTVDMTRYPYERWLSAPWLSVQSEQELARIEERHRRTWVLYIFPTRLAAVHPEIWARIQRSYTPAGEYPGTVGGGTVVIMVRG